MALTREDIRGAAELLGVEPAIVAAVADVESSGSGFLADGRPKILFEGHVFWKQLTQRGIDPVPLAAKHPTIVYPRWTRKNYLGGAREYERLALAREIHDEAALCSASWGAFQIMGFNYGAAGFNTVHDFVAAHERGESEHLLAFCRFIKSRGLGGAMQRRDWAAFARGYNGPGFAKNRYDTRLEDAYTRRLSDRWDTSSA